ncbi:MAG TPA: Gfo/Idh/MocA family oxidoreductase [Solirubrobacteraceae bacterium]|nr:Gfo/Idh/MocA family oxidoreductase [Solirubrobacteraceae bacterium]
MSAGGERSTRSAFERSVLSVSRVARPPVTVGVVGLGYWGPNLLRVLYETRGVNVTWMCDRDTTRLDRLAQRYPAVRRTAEFADLLADPDLDAIVIATPVFTHLEFALRSLDAGKHTFVEKPLAPSVGEADALIDRARASGLVLMCGLTFLYSPPVRAIKRLIDDGDLGEIYFISSSRVNLGLHQRDVSVVWDLAPHDFSILLYWLGETPEVINAIGRDSIVPGTPDVAFIDLTFGSGIVANVELSWLAPRKLRRMVVVGSDKMVVYDDSSLEPVRVFDSGVVYRDPETFGEYQLSYRTGDIVSLQLDGAEPLALELSDFVRAIGEGQAPFRLTEIARDVVEMIERTERSLDASRNPAREAARAMAASRRVRDGLVIR